MKLNKITKYELIAPAGNLLKAKYAFKFGADSVYLGIPDFSLRTRVNSFDENSIPEIINYAHSIGKKVFITVNIFAHNEHISRVASYLKKIEKWEADAVIASDPGIIAMVKKYAPKTRIHLSTQANCTNWSAAKFWYDMGIKRVVLGREVTLAEIAEIKKHVPKLELEYFVHGAMCMAYSGRCFLSSHFTGKSANLGDCTQPCRWEYDYYIEEKKRPGELLKVEQDSKGSYFMNSKDLCLIKYLEDLKKAGVTSFKIEGRAKSIYYVAFVSKIYSEALRLKGTLAENKKKINAYYKELQTLAHRDYTVGFVFGKEKVEQKNDSSHIVTNYQFVGEVLGMEKEKYMKVKVHNVFFVGDKIDIIQPTREMIKMTIKEMTEEDGTKIKEAHGGQDKRVLIKVNKDVEPMALIRKKS